MFKPTTPKNNLESANYFTLLNYFFTENKNSFFIKNIRTACHLSCKLYVNSIYNSGYFITLFKYRYISPPANVPQILLRNNQKISIYFRALSFKLHKCIVVNPLPLSCHLISANIKYSCNILKFRIVLLLIEPYK